MLRKWMAEVLDIVGDEDLVVSYYDILRALYYQGESPQNAADWIRALDSGD